MLPKTPSLRPHHQKQRYRGLHLLLQLRPPGAGIIFRRIEPEQLLKPKAIRRIRRFPFRRGFHKGLDAHLVRFVEAPLYEHAADAATPVFWMDVED